MTTPDLPPRIVARPGFRGGKPCLAGCRSAVDDVRGWLAAGMTPAEILSDFPELAESHLLAAVEFVRGEPQVRSTLAGNGSGVYPGVMATKLKLDPGLQEVVDRARRQARADGELLDGPRPPLSSGLSPEIRAVVADWVDSGDYDRAVAEIVADDPDLATQ